LNENKTVMIFKPNQWIKSINLSMLKYFFEIEMLNEAPITDPKKKRHSKLFTGGAVSKSRNPIF
jgi:hypothetical protein